MNIQRTLSLIVSLIFFLSAGVLAKDAPINSPPGTPPATPAPDFKKLNVLSKFTDKKSADTLAYSLNKSGQKVRVISKKIDISLKSLSIGLFLTRMRAEHTVKRLKKNDIDAFVHELKSGKFRVYAGAMQNESNFWQRYEKLMALGYDKPDTTIQIVQATEYYVVSDKKEKISLPKKIKSVAHQTKTSNFKTEFDRARFKGEFSIWGDEDNRSSSNYFDAALSLRTKYKSNLDFTYGTRFTATEQSAEENIQKFELQWQPTYLRYSKQKQQWILGAMYARWDDINPNNEHDTLSDRLSSKVLVRYKLDYEIVDKRRPVFGVRWKYKTEQYDFDVIWTPVFRPAKLPDFGSIWHPVRRADGVIRGIKPTKDWQDLVQRGSFADEKMDSGGAGVRVAKRVGSRTRAITLQYARRNEPYYALNPKIAQQLKAGKTVDFAFAAAPGYTFSPVHPYSGILNWEESGKVSHFEFALLSAAPYTNANYEYKTAASAEWKLGFIYPTKDKKSHVSIYLTGRHINTGEKILDRKTKSSLLGELYQISKSGIWKAGTAYEIGLDQVELFINPRVTFQQSKYIRIFLSYQLFAGSPNTASGYHTKNSILSLTWQAVF